MQWEKVKIQRYELMCPVKLSSTKIEIEEIEVLTSSFYIKLSTMKSRFRGEIGQINLPIILWENIFLQK